MGGAGGFLLVLSKTSRELQGSSSFSNLGKVLKNAKCGSQSLSVSVF